MINLILTLKNAKITLHIFVTLQRLIKIINESNEI